MKSEYSITVVDGASKLALLIEAAKNSTYHEYDCSREDYLNHLVKVVYKNNNYRSLLLYFKDQVVGYFISRLDNYLKHEVVVVDVCINKDHQGKAAIQHFIGDLIYISYKTGAKRVCWHSYVFGKEFWNQHSFGFEVKEHHALTVEFPEVKKESFMRAYSSFKGEV